MYTATLPCLSAEQIVVDTKTIREAIAKNELDVIIREEKEYEGGLHLYRVVIQGNYFECGYTEEEMNGIVQTCSDILRELYKIACNGYTKEKLIESEAREMANHPDMTHESDGVGKPTNMMAVLKSYNDFMTSRLEELVAKLGSYTRTGGAYYMFLSRPVFVSAIFSVFEMLLGRFDDESVWTSSLIFLIRGAMYMHSNELSEEEGKKYFPDYAG